MYCILDGGTATELVREGHDNIFGDPLWSARLLHTNPEALLQMHKRFLEAGSDVIVTVSYQASIDGFMKHLAVSEEEAEKLMKKSVEIAKKACEEVSKDKGTILGKVAGSVGPYGAVLQDGSEYTGGYVDNMTEKELMDWHRPRLKALIDAGADYVAIETIPSIKEAECVTKLVSTEFPHAKALVTFSCKNGQETCHGEPFIEAIKCVSQYEQVVAVGCNCTEPKYITSLLKSIQTLSLQKPVIVKPNSGEQWKPSVGWYGKEDCKPLSEYAKEWIECGAKWLGGCCQVFPNDIQDLKESVLKCSKV